MVIRPYLSDGGRELCYKVCLSGGGESRRMTGRMGVVENKRCLCIFKNRDKRLLDVWWWWVCDWCWQKWFLSSEESCKCTVEVYYFTRVNTRSKLTVLLVWLGCVSLIYENDDGIM